MARAPSILTPLGAVLAELEAVLRPVVPRRVPLREAIGQTLAEPLVVAAPAPARTVALEPGYAVAACDLVGVSSYAPLVLRLAPPRVDIGDPLPPSADAVLPHDAVDFAGGLFEVTASVAPGENVRRAGEDARPGQVLREAGEILRPLDAATALAAGLDEAMVRSPAVQLLLDEPDGRGHDLGLLSAGFDGARITVVRLPAETAAWEGLRSLPADLAVLVTDALEDMPAALQDERILADRVALGSAERTKLVLRGRTPVIVAPRRLDAFLAVRLCLIDPVLTLLGRRPAAPWRRAPLARKLSSRLGLTEVALLREADGRFEPLGLGTLSLPAIARAQGWLAVPPDSEGFQAGDVVDAYSL